MRKVVGGIILLLSLIALLSGMKQSFINKLKYEKYFDHLNPDANRSGLHYKLLVATDRWGYGDLYGIAYLPQYKIKLEPFKAYTKPESAPKTNRVLYIIGDSFLADKTLWGAFDGFDNVVFLDRRFPYGPVGLDSTKQNYLIMEFAERNLNGYDLAKSPEIKWTVAQIKEGANFKSTSSGGSTFVESTRIERINNILFNKDLSRNLELVLFDHKFITPFKEVKAALNYLLFGRVANEVAVSTKKDRLFLNVTVDPSSKSSSFNLKTDNEVAQIVQNLHKAEAYYKAIGFKKVLLSVIPNSVSVYDENRMPYNHLLERVERNTGLTTIPLYQLYKANKQNLFYRSDAHWNPAGLNAWVEQTNKVLNANLH